jgi:membrane fusion protein, macrolide-specific efflux system
MNKKYGLIISLIVVSAIAGIIFFLKNKKTVEDFRTAQVKVSSFEVSVSSMATVQPENKIVIIPPVRGRIEEILVKEGSRVKAGQVLAIMSSADRAAILDAAQSQGAEDIKKWKEMYKPTPIFSPSSGTIIATSIVTGQTVQQTDTLFELSDRLVINAQVDEADISGVHLKQKARVKIDSFPDEEFFAQVVKISQKSTLTNGVNIFNVLLYPESEQKQIRAGMTASTQFIVYNKENALLIPSFLAAGRENTEIELKVLKPTGPKNSFDLRSVKIGKNNGEYVEVLENLTENETILYSPLNLPTAKQGLSFLKKQKKEN